MPWRSFCAILARQRARAENAIERAVVICRSEVIRPEDLAITVLSSTSGVETGWVSPVPGSRLWRSSALRSSRRWSTPAARHQSGGDAGISPRKIQYKLREYQQRPSASKPLFPRSESCRQ